MRDRTERPLLLGHRGARAQRSIPENTLASFDRALADGCDGFEFDVRLTADGVAVVCHDPRSAGLEIAQVRTERLAALPRLEDVLSRYHQRAFLDIELKVAGLEAIVAAMVRTFPPQRGFVISSFLPKVLEQMHAHDRAIPLGLICETRAELARWKDLPVEYVIPQAKLVDSKNISMIKDAGKKVLVWTVNDPEEMLRFAQAGVDGIISDDTSLLVRTLSS
ncbi:MAG TPA: glycerophosphodiester phosphodiesterase [Candidatus Binatia bacterium]|nr:glycerophosphodiester phosphodiesterase [Candidatus Binatia bacterium]